MLNLWRIRGWTAEIKYFFQRGFRGWSDDNLWSLDLAMFKWILPQLRAFKQGVDDGSISGIPAILAGYEDAMMSGDPGWEKIQEDNRAEWSRIIGEMIYALEYVGFQGWPMDSEAWPEYKRVTEGYAYFVEYLPALWD